MGQVIYMVTMPSSLSLHAQEVALSPVFLSRKGWAKTLEFLPSFENFRTEFLSCLGNMNEWPVGNVRREEIFSA